MAMESFDLVVVGAGWYGLAATKTYVELNPSDRVLVVEANSTVGGTWASHRLYSGLRSNNLLGTFEFIDFPMDTATYGVKPGEHIPGSVLHLYLTRYAEHFGVYPHIRFSTQVRTAERKEGGGWILTTAPAEDGTEVQIFASKLIVATGLTSEPHIPDVSGRDAYTGLLFHSRDANRHTATLRPGALSSIVVVSGSKSAWDVAYTYATAVPPVPVDLVIRTSGRGPVWMSPPYVTPFKRWLEKLVHTRLLTLFSPCPWGAADGYGVVRRILHGTWLGRKVVDAFWRVLSADVLGLVGYDRHPETAKLKPWTSAFWIGAGFGIINYPTDFLELVREGRIRVHLSDVEHLSERSVHLANGDVLDAPAICFATGWKAHPAIAFSGPGASSGELGLPFMAPAGSEIARRLVRLNAEADEDILSRFPRLRDQPQFKPPSGATIHRGATASTESDFRDEIEFQLQLYKFMVPPSSFGSGHRDIAFAGFTYTVSTTLTCEVQALWISAFFANKLAPDAPDGAAAEREAAVWNRFGRWRYVAGYGGRVPDSVFDAVPYFDALVGDLGLARRGTGLLTAVGLEHYQGLVREWKEKMGS